MTIDTSGGPLLLRIREVQKLTGYSRAHVYKMINQGRLPVVRLGKTVRIPRQGLERWLEREIQVWENAQDTS